MSWVTTFANSILYTFLPIVIHNFSLLCLKCGNGGYKCRINLLFCLITVDVGLVNDTLVLVLLKQFNFLLPYNTSWGTMRLSWYPAIQFNPYTFGGKRRKSNTKVYEFTHAVSFCLLYFYLFSICGLLLCYIAQCILG